MAHVGPARVAAQSIGADESSEPPTGDPVAAARAEFASGVAHAQASEWPAAEAAFRRALALHPAPAIHINLANALTEQGRYREAHGALRVAEATADLPEPLREPMGRLRARIDSESGRLAITQSGDAVGASVQIDADPVPAEWLGADIPVSPGAHAVRAVRGEQILASVDVTARAGERTAVVLGVSERLVEAPPPNGGSSDLIIGLGVGAGVAALAVAAIVIAVLATSSGAPPVSGNFDPGLVSWP